MLAVFRKNKAKTKPILKQKSENRKQMIERTDGRWERTEDRGRKDR
jgi:hypothetical protein